MHLNHNLLNFVQHAYRFILLTFDNTLIIEGIEYLIFFILYGWQFAYIDDKWKWRESTTNSIVVPNNVTLVKLVVWLTEKLQIHDPFSVLLLKFKVPDMHILSIEIHEDENLNWYIFTQRNYSMSFSFQKRIQVTRYFTKWGIRIYQGLHLLQSNGGNIFYDSWWNVSLD